MKETIGLIQPAPRGLRGFSFQRGINRGTAMMVRQLRASGFTVTLEREWLADGLRGAFVRIEK